MSSTGADFRGVTPLVLKSAFDHYAPVARGRLPERGRTDHNPLNRKEYLLNVTRRVSG